MTKTPKLVSVLTPCYNGEKYIHRLLDSILNQTYPLIEMIIIDDGSTDTSAQIIHSYIPKFKQKGYVLKCIFQENQGQSVAINRGLKFIDGDYLVWPDADDHYASSNSISEMVKVLDRSGANTSMVRVQYNVLAEDESLISKLGVNDNSRYKTELFEDCLFKYGQGFWGAAGGYMAKVEKIDEHITGRNIYTEKGAGQNWQLCLPLLYQQECITLEKYLYSIIEHEDSHSRNEITHHARQQIYYRTIKNTLDKIELDKGYKKYITKRLARVYSTAQVSTPKRPYRTYVKRAVKAITPYGLMMLYRRRHL